MAMHGGFNLSPGCQGSYEITYQKRPNAAEFILIFRLPRLNDTTSNDRLRPLISCHGCRIRIPACGVFMTVSQTFVTQTHD